MLNGSDHGSPGGARFIARNAANTGLEHTGQNDPQGLGACGSTGDADFFRDRTHGRITIAGRKRQTFKNTAHHVMIIGRGIEAVEHGASRRFHEGAAFPGFRNIGVVHDFGRFTGQQFFIHAVKQFTAGFFNALVF